MNPKQRRRIAKVLKQHPDATLVYDDTAPTDKLFLSEDGGTISGGLNAITTARDIRNNIFVPGLYSGEESTWA